VRAGASRPQPAANLPADHVELTDVAVGEARSHDPIVDGARRSSNSAGVPPARSTSRSSMLSAPDSIPASTVAVLAALFTPVGPGTVNAPATSAHSPIRSVSTAAVNNRLFADEGVGDSGASLPG